MEVEKYSVASRHIVLFIYVAWLCTLDFCGKWCDMGQMIQGDQWEGAHRDKQDRKSSVSLDSPLTPSRRHKTIGSTLQNVKPGEAIDPRHASMS